MFAAMVGEGAVQSNDELEEGALPPARILAVDDVPANLLALSAVLEPLGHEVVEASSGAEALARAAEDEFAVILLDVMMPGMDGFETLARLRRIPLARHTPVVFLTAYDLDARAVERAYAMGAVDYVPKPIAMPVLRGKVASLVLLYRRGKELRNRGAALAAKDRHIAVLAHDLRNPLASITMTLQQLERSATDDKTRARVERIRRVAARMDNMIRDLLDYARAGTDRIPIAPGAMDLGDLCHELVEEFELADPERSIELTTRGELAGLWDRARLHQAISNLVGNATRYGEGKAKVEVRRAEDRVEVRVHNDGPPIAAEMLPVIFEPFERGEESRTGLGLGLYIVREIARAHGGSVSVDSAPGQGTTFTLRLPLGAAPPAPGGQTQS
jgi:signal transduction histidine kinase